MSKTNNAMTNSNNSRKHEDVMRRWLEWEQDAKSGLSPYKIGIKRGFNHSTVYHGLRRLKELREIYKKIK